MRGIIFLSARTPNQTNRETGKRQLPLTNALLYQNFLGLLKTRLARFLRLLFGGLAASNDKNKAGLFYWPTTKAKPANVASADRLLSSSIRSAYAMPDTILSISPEESNFDHLSEAELSALLDLLTHQIEYHRDELIRLRPLLHRLQANIPNNPFQDFINTLD